MKYLALVLGMLAVTSVRAQFLTPQYHSHLASNVLFVELLGNGQNWSLNYEQLFAMGDYIGATARFGGSVFPAGNRILDFNVPVTVSGIFGKNNLYGELGAGANVNFDSNLLETGAEFMGTGILGIRYHPSHRGGIFLKLAYTPFYRDNTILHHGGFAIGFGFDGK